MQRLFVFFLLIINAMSVFAYSKSATVDRLVHRYMRQYYVRGAEIAIMQKGKLVYTQGYGYADQAKKIKPSTQSLFRVASISKVITGMTVLRLIQEGKLHYNDKVISILNDIKPLPGMRITRRMREVTVKDLLLMSSGWRNVRVNGLDPLFGPIPKRLSKGRSVKAPLSCYRAARFMLGVPMHNKPGTKFGYANINYCYLGLIISKVNHLPYTSTAYEAYIKKHILLPLGITNMRLGSTAKTAVNEVHYYAKPATEQFPYSKTNILQKTYPLAAWLASPVDLVHFFSRLPRLLSRWQLAFITRKQVGIFYAPGKYKGKNYYYSSGWWLYPEGKQLLWIAHGSFTGSMNMVLKSSPHTMVALSFNTLAKPTSPAYQQLRVLLQKVLAE